ncbi:MAG TPA: phenylacetate--CoA ligase [Dissulfurispiraceae bacterium]|nr:phenylacetate--CoA ligase [Dissulfurispiraceae bacterium]
MYWEAVNECMPRDEREQLQLERLQATLFRVYMNVPFYRKTFDTLGIDPDGFRSLDDLRKLPFTTKDDLRASYPYGMFAVPLRDVVRIQASSGTTGTPTVVGYTRNDIKHWSTLVARVLTAGGVTQNDIVQIAFDYGLFTGAFGFHYGAERIGSSVIPISSGNTARQIKIMRDFRTSVLLCTPSYASALADALEESGTGMSSLSLKYGLFGAEPWSETLRTELQERLKITATDNYGLSEVMGPGVAGECLDRNGLHINEDHFLVEIINPETLEPVAPGEIGELVITTLTREAFPVVRYRTRDLTRLIPEPCVCGRTLTKMAKIMGRTDDMMKIRGITVFPLQIESVLCAADVAELHYQIEIDRKGALDEMIVFVEVSDTLFSDEMKELQGFIDRTKRALEIEIGFPVGVKPVEKMSLKRFEGKACRVIDRRKR